MTRKRREKVFLMAVCITIVFGSTPPLYPALAAAAYLTLPRTLNPRVI